MIFNLFVFAMYLTGLFFPPDTFQIYYGLVTIGMLIFQ